MSNVFESEGIMPVMLFEGHFDSSVVRLWTGIGDLIWNGQKWLGAGGLIAVSAVQNTNEIRANGISVTLSGIPSDFIRTVIVETRLSKEGRIYLGVVTSENNHNLNGEPKMIFRGYCDVPQITHGENSCSITIAYENSLIDLNRSSAKRYNKASQQVLYPNDKGFDSLDIIQGKALLWGS